MIEQYKPTSRVLLLEDNEEIRELLSSLITSYGCKPVIACTQTEVDGHLAQGSISLAFLDIMLPSVDGRNIANELRKRNFEFPIYFMTGVPSLVRRQDKKLVNGVLTKPFTIEELRKILDMHLRPPQTIEPANDDLHLLEALTAVATEYEALRRQTFRASKLMTQAKSTAKDQKFIDCLNNVLREQNQSLDHLSSLLENTHSLLKNRIKQ